MTAACSVSRLCRAYNRHSIHTPSAERPVPGEQSKPRKQSWKRELSWVMATWDGHTWVSVGRADAHCFRTPGTDRDGQETSRGGRCVWGRAFPGRRDSRGKPYRERERAGWRGEAAAVGGGAVREAGPLAFTQQGWAGRPQRFAQDWSAHPTTLVDSMPPSIPSPYPGTQAQTLPSPGLSPKLASGLGQHGAAGCGGVCV